MSEENEEYAAQFTEEQFHDWHDLVSDEIQHIKSLAEILMRTADDLWDRMSPLNIT